MTARKKPLPPGIRETALPSGRVRYKVTVDVAPKGQKRQQVYRTCDTLTEAKQTLRVLRGEVAAGKYRPKSRETVNGRLDSWLAVKRHEVRPVTLRGYRDSAQHWRKAFGERKVQSLTRDDVQQAVDAMHAAGKTGRTVQAALVVLRASLALAVRDGIVPRNVASGVKAPRYVPPARRAWTPQEATVFLAAVAGDRLEALYRLILLGLRRGEVLGLQWSDVDLDAPSLRVARSRVAVTATETMTDEPKVKRSKRTLPLGGLPSVVEALRTLRRVQQEERLRLGRPWDEDRPVAVDEVGRPMRPERYSDLWREACQAAGVPVLTLHEARHTAATLLAEAEVAPEVAAQWLGHDPAMYLRTYVHPRAERVAKAGEALGAAFG